MKSTGLLVYIYMCVCVYLSSCKYKQKKNLFSFFFFYSSSSVFFSITNGIYLLWTGSACCFFSGKWDWIFFNDLVYGSRHTNQTNACKVHLHMFLSFLWLAVSLLHLFLLQYQELSLLLLSVVTLGRITNGASQVLNLFQNKAFTCEYK